MGDNYDEHRIETERDATQNPLLFMRVAESQTAHLQPILLPAESTKLDCEGEIAIVIGKSGRRIKAADAWMLQLIQGPLVAAVVQSGSAARVCGFW